MRHLYILSVFTVLLLGASARAETANPDTSWKRGGFAALNFNQGTFYQWAPGGQSNLAFTGLFNYYFNYNDGIDIWKNELNLSYGTVRNFDLGSTNQIDAFWKKNEDRINFESKYDRKASKKFFYSANLLFLSQFDKGFVAPDYVNPKSDFLAPALGTIGVGMKWKPTDYFDVFLSPASGKFTYVRLQDLADQGVGGVRGADKDPLTGLLIAGTGQRFRPEFGASLILNFNKKELIKNVDLNTNLTLFNNYTDTRVEKRQNMFVLWNWTLFLKVSKYISASIIGQMIYDDNVNVIKKVEQVRDANGLLTQKVLQQGKGIQLKNVLGIGFSYKFKY